ncbi:hypothetical protein ACFQH9_28380 [Pseudonocardia lutea]|uniref:Capsular polysaccharide biosynthesis protein n=1 Tax=Pseudonocardia lutea TaxID=2172015 RepID=A0ABW1IH92_9PSEU
MAGIALLVAGCAAVFSWWQTPLYEATARVVVLPLVSSSNPPPQEPSMGTEKEIASSDLVVSTAARRLAVPLGELRQDLAVTVPVDTHVLEIACTREQPDAARECAQEVAEAFVTYKDTEPIPTLPERARVLTPAAAPSGPSSPKTGLNILIGLVVGGLLGLLVAMARDRLDHRIRGSDGLEARGLNVLGEVPPLTPGPDADRSATDDGADASGGETVDDVAYEILAERIRAAVERSGSGRLVPRARAHGNVLVLTGVGDVAVATFGRRLATALLVDGRHVVVVDGDTRAGAAGRSTTGPGLLDVLAGRVPVEAAVRREAAGPALLGAGQPGPDLGRRISERAWSTTSATLTRSFSHVVVGAPPVLESADAVRLIASADGVVLVVGTGTPAAEVDRAVAELTQVGAEFVGTVLVTSEQGSRRSLSRPLPQRRPRGRAVPDHEGAPGPSYSDRLEQAAPDPSTLPVNGAQASATSAGSCSGTETPGERGSSGSEGE